MLSKQLFSLVEPDFLPSSHVLHPLPLHTLKPGHCVCSESTQILIQTILFHNLFDALEPAFKFVLFKCHFLKSFDIHLPCLWLRAPKILSLCLSSIYHSRSLTLCMSFLPDSGSLRSEMLFFSLCPLTYNLVYMNQTVWKNKMKLNKVSFT